MTHSNAKSNKQVLLVTSDFMRRSTPVVVSFVVGREDKRTNNRTMLPTLKNNAAAGYKGPEKIELLKDAGLLDFIWKTN